MNKEACIANGRFSGDSMKAGRLKRAQLRLWLFFYEASVTISGQSSAVKAQIRRLPDFCSSSFVCSQPNRHLHQTVNNQQWPRKQRPTSSSCFSTTSHIRLPAPRSFNSILAPHRPQQTILSFFSTGLSFDQCQPSYVTLFFTNCLG